MLTGYAASYAAGAELQEEGILPPTLTVGTTRYFNNVIEQDHRRVKQRVRPMLELKRFDHAAITIIGCELIHHIKKKPFDVSVLCSPSARLPQVWDAVLPERYTKQILVYLRSANCTTTI